MKETKNKRKAKNMKKEKEQKETNKEARKELKKDGKKERLVNGSRQTDSDHAPFTPSALTVI
jgi:hypothetical protein